MTKEELTVADIQKARTIYPKNEPRDLFYRAATELVELALRSASSLSVAEALAVLLQTWNRSYHRFHKFDVSHFKDIERLLSKHSDTLAHFRDQEIDGLSDQDEISVSKLFIEFENVLGPVGAAKALHLLAPQCFPLWDNAIARKGYKLGFGLRGLNNKRYWKFLLITKRQYSKLKCEGMPSENLLKLIDEYNYCKFTMGLLE